MANPKPVFGAFNQGVIPTIACFNKAKTPLGVKLDALIAAMAFEEEFGCEIPDDAAEKILTVKDAIAFIETNG